MLTRLKTAELVSISGGTRERETMWAYGPEPDRGELNPHYSARVNSNPQTRLA
jgi:hypothetical protein